MSSGPSGTPPPEAPSDAAPSPSTEASSEPASQTSAEAPSEPAPGRPPGLGPSDEDRYGWSGTAGRPPEVELTRLARLLARSGGRLIGLLPADDGLDPPTRLAPALAGIAEALLGFLPGEVGLIDTWRTWPWGEAMAVGESAAHRMRWLRPRIMEISPPPCNDVSAAEVALQNALASVPASLAAVIVNLGGYSPLGAVPRAIEFVDGLVLLVAARRTRLASVARLRNRLANENVIGGILFGADR
jgi:hypothetical protein